MLGGHVPDRAAIGPCGVADPPGEALVGDQRLTPRVKEDVARLEVEVDDALLMDVMDGPGDLGREASDLLLLLFDGLPLRSGRGGRGRQAIGVKVVRQAPFSQFHGEVELVLMLADVVDAHEMFVL